MLSSLFKNMFELFHSFYNNAGAEKAANDMQEISNIFVACNHATVAGCISYLSSLMTENKPIKSKRRTSMVETKMQFDLDIVEKYTQALRQAMIITILTGLLRSSAVTRRAGCKKLEGYRRPILGMS